MNRLALFLTLLAGPSLAEPLTVATGGHFPPYIFDPGTPQARGFDKDVVTELCARGDYECTWVDLPMSDIFAALARGDVDIVAGGFGYSTERDALVDFTCPYVLAGENTGTFIAPTPELDLSTARIGAQEQSLYSAAMVQAKRNVVTFPTEDAALLALQAGEIDAVFGSHYAISLAERIGGLYNVAEYPTFSGGTVIGVSEDAPDLLANLNALLQDMSEDGTLSRLQVQWLGGDQGDVIAHCFDLNALT